MIAASYITIGYAKNESILKSFSSADHFGRRFGRVKQFLSPALYLVPFISKYVIFLIPTVLVTLYIADLNRLFVGSHLFSLVPVILTLCMYDIMQRASVKYKNILMAVMFVGLIFSFPIWKDILDLQPDKRASVMREAVSLVKDNGSVTTARKMGISFNHRKEFYLLDNQKLSDYMVVDRKTGEYNNKERKDFNASYEQSVEYMKVMDKENIAVFIKKERIAKILQKDIQVIENMKEDQIIKEIKSIQQ